MWQTSVTEEWSGKICVLEKCFNCVVKKERVYVFIVRSTRSFLGHSLSVLFAVLSLNKCECVYAFIRFLFGGNNVYVRVCSSSPLCVSKCVSRNVCTKCMCAICVCLMVMCACCFMGHLLCACVCD